MVGSNVGGNAFFDQICTIAWHVLCDFIATIKICKYHLYCDIHFSFQGDVFMNFQALINCAYESINFC